MSQRVPVGLVGGSSKAASYAQQSARTVNMIPEANDPDAKAPVALISAPGFFRWADFTGQFTGSPQIRAFHLMGDRFFCVVAEKIAEVNYNVELTSFSSLTLLASLATFSGRVTMSDNNGKLIVGDGTGFYVLDLDTRVLSPVLNEGEEQIIGTDSAWLDGYTIYFERDSGKYHWSALNDPLTVDGLNFFSAEGNPDKILRGIVSNREVIILGKDSTEWHQNSGGANSAFSRIPGGFVEYGCAARWTAAKHAGGIAMVGRNQEGQGKVVLLGTAGTEPQVISNTAVEKALEKVFFSAIDRADLTEQITAFSYEDAGRKFYVLNLPAVPGTVNSPARPSQTWVHDATMPAALAWTERAYTNPATGLYERILSDHHVMFRGRHYTGAYNLAHIYEMSFDYYRENTLELVKMRESTHLSFGGQLFTVEELEIQGQTGVGRDGGVQGSDPLVSLQYSWDGKPWSNEITRRWGAIGQPETRAIFGPLGSGYDLVVRVSCSEPIPFTLTAGWATVSLG